MARTGMMVARDLLHVTANENVGMGATGGGYFHHGDVTIAGCALRLGRVIETSGYERVTSDTWHVSICHG